MMPASYSCQSPTRPPGKTGDWDRNPCRTAFRAERAFPSADRGPLDLAAFLLFADDCSAVVMIWSPGEEVADHGSGTAGLRSAACAQALTSRGVQANLPSSHHVRL